MWIDCRPGKRGGCCPTLAIPGELAGVRPATRLSGGQSLHAAYLISVWLHIVAMTIWVGSMLFLSLVVVPWLRGPGRPLGVALLRDTGGRLRGIAWTCFAVLLATGSFNLFVRGVRWSSFVDRSWLSSSFGHLVLGKLSLFALVLALSALHDFRIGPRATLALERDPQSARAARLRRVASWFGRVNLLLGLVLILLGVMIVRGAL